MKDFYMSVRIPVELSNLTKEEKVSLVNESTLEFSDCARFSDINLDRAFHIAVKKIRDTGNMEYYVNKYCKIEDKEVIVRDYPRYSQI